MPAKGKGNGKKKGKGNSKKAKTSFRAEDPTVDCIFPREIVYVILSRLPVKSLLRFRCVCKPWRKFISKPHFIDSHMKHHSSFSQPNSLIIQTHHCEGCSPFQPNPQLHRCDSKGFTLSLFNPSESPSVTQLDKAVPHGRVIVGSCNGIVCLFKAPWAREITLWNPAMRHSRTIMCPTMPRLDILKLVYMSIGLAYNSQENDFFILRLWNLAPPGNEFFPNAIEVYSVKNSRWTELKNDLVFKVFKFNCDVIIKGVPYWFATVSDGHELRSVVVLFNPVRKVFDKLPWPPGIRSGVQGLLVDLKDSLCMITWDENKKSYLDLCVMDGADGWSTKYSVGPLFGFDEILKCSRNGHIVAMNEKGELLLIDPMTSLVKVKAKLCDNAKKAKHLVFYYSESLVLVTGMVPLKKKAAGDNLARENLLMAGINSMVISPDNDQQKADGPQAG